jgi:hypothetical protein
MEWVIAEHSRCDIHFYSGINFSGEHRVVHIHPAGGRQGQKIDDFPFQSVAIAAPMGTRIVFATSVQDDWEQRPWRAVELRKGEGFKDQNGLPAVRVPDLNWLDKPVARRTDPDFQEGFRGAQAQSERPAWSYGRGPGELSGAVACIRVDRPAAT